MSDSSVYFNKHAFPKINESVNVSKKGSLYLKSDTANANDHVNDTFDNISHLNMNKSKNSLHSYNNQGDEASMSLKDHNTSQSSSRVISGSGRDLRMIDCRLNQSKSY